MIEVVQPGFSSRQLKLSCSPGLSPLSKGEIQKLALKREKGYYRYCNFSESCKMCHALMYVKVLAHAQ